MPDRPPTEDHPDVERRGASVDVDAIRAVIEEHPVDLAVLFGSTVMGTADPGSDIDIAIELRDDLDVPRTEAVMELLVDLSIALDRNDIDLSLVDDLKPRVGLAAFEHGELLLGDPERAAVHREQFARRVDEQRTEPLRQRLDEAIEHVDRVLDEGAR